MHNDTSTPLRGQTGIDTYEVSGMLRTLAPKARHAVDIEIGQDTLGKVGYGSGANQTPDPGRGEAKVRPADHKSFPNDLSFCTSTSKPTANKSREWQRYIRTYCLALRTCWTIEPYYHEFKVRRPEQTVKQPRRSVKTVKMRQSETRFICHSSGFAVHPT